MDMIKFAREVEEFSKVDPELQLNTLLVFLYVAQRGVCTQKDVELHFGMNNATASRNVAYWTEHKRYEQAGQGFVKREEDPKDRRYKLLSLTPKGKRFYDTIRSKTIGKEERNQVAG